MQEENLTQEGKNPEYGQAGSPEEYKPIIIKIKPGTAAEKSMRFLLPTDYVEDSVDNVVKYALGLQEEDGIKREGLRIQGKIGTEMNDKYGITVNGEAIKGINRLSDYLKEAQSTSGKQYLEAEIIIAAKQEGAGKLESMLGYRGYRI